MAACDFRLRHPAGVEISRALTETQLLSALPEAEGSKHDMRTGWVWYPLPSFLDGDICIRVALGFNRGELEQVSLAAGDPKLPTGWANWSEEREHATVARTDKWLAQLGFPPGVYAWGEVWVAYDQKGASGGGGVRFAP